jgi:hypothetical protein
MSKDCKDCNGHKAGFLCPFHAYFSRQELYKTGQDCWHPIGTALAWNEEEEGRELPDKGIEDWWTPEGAANVWNEEKQG